MPVELALGLSQIEPYIHGHTLAENRGLTDYGIRGLPFRGERYEPYVTFGPGGPAFNPTLLEDIRRSIQEHHPACIVMAVLGSYHWTSGVCNEPRAYDFIVPQLPQHALSPGTELVPYDMMLRLVRSGLDWMFGIVREVRKLSNVPIFHIEAPPPVQSTEMMLRGVYGPFKEKMEQFGVPSKSFRYKIWWLWVHVAKQLCAELGDHFVEGPPATRDGDGFLQERYYFDGVHGNQEYGAVMVQAVAVARRHLGLSGH